MARITIEDCLKKVPNKFVLVRMAIIRAYQLVRNARPLVDNLEGNKEIVLALREIADNKILYKEVKEEDKKYDEKILF